MKTLITHGQIVTLNKKSEVIFGDLLIEGQKITRIAKKIDPAQANLKVDQVIDAQGGFVIPGLIQAHTHLCQTMFRGFADDLVLMDWLEQKIWPMENGHNEQSLYESARIGLLEMQLSGTTTILDMGTVQHTDALFEASQESGMRYIGGNCLMDLKGSCGPLWQGRKAALKEVSRLISKWHKKDSLIEYTLNPRFAISCSDELLRDCVEIQNSEGVRIHTHASESQGEIDIVRARTGMENVDYLDSLGMLNENTIIVHGVHLKQRELKKMIKKGTPLVHCPSSNLKLASGIAPIEHYHNQGLKILAITRWIPF
jgi:5-methylthioadenosine/S-adenosylhomocysteine deaminase